MKDGEPQVGVVTAPVTGEIFSARKGGGAKANGKRIRVSNTTKMSEALVICEIPRRYTAKKHFARDLQNFAKSLNKARRARAFAAAAYGICLVAKGAADAYLDFSRNTKIWDVAAGWLIVREAGGRVSDNTLPSRDKTRSSVLATNQKLHAGFRKLLS
jgi:myo-inositol-1(or 4)-monophosphatase